jgi:uridine kinase
MKAISPLVERLRALLQSSSQSIVVAIDGRSGVGKSTLASGLGELFDATIVSGDDFYIGGVTVRNESPETLFANCMDWQAARKALRELVLLGETRYRAFDWIAFDGGRCSQETVHTSKPIVVLEGVYSGRVELRDLVDISVLVTAPEHERVRRLVAREGQISDWEAQWHRAEEWYFSRLVDRDQFDIVIPTDRGGDWTHGDPRTH